MKPHDTQRFIKEREIIISKLSEFFTKNFSNYNIDLAFLYGSWAHGYPHYESDVDLAVVFRQGIDDEQEIFMLIMDISYDLNIFLKKDVNIIPILNDFRHPMLYYNAVIQGVPVFIGQHEKYVFLKMKAVEEMEDFGNYGISWQRKIAENLMRR